jgi:uncharacterized protein YndB with AHSA1/START domain
VRATTVTTPNELKIGVERIFDAPRTHVYSVWTDPELIPEWWGDGTVVEEMDVRLGGTYRFQTAFGVVEGEFREVEPPSRLVQTFQNHLQTLEFEDVGERTKLTQTMRFETTEQRDTTMQYGIEEGAKGASRASTRCWRRSRREAVACAAQAGQARAAAYRSTVGTVSDANAVLRVLFSRLGKPYVGLPNAFSFNDLSVRADGQISIEKGAGKTEKRVSGGACHSTAGPALELRQGFQPQVAMRRFL